MRAKQKELIRDLVKLTSKYSSRDWEPIVRLLRAGESKIADLISQIDAVGKNKKASAKRVIKPTATATPTRKKSTPVKKTRTLKKRKSRSSVVEITGRQLPATVEYPESWIKGVLIGTPLSELHQLYFRVVGSKQLPPGRDAVIRALIAFLQRSSPEQLSAFTTLIQRRSNDETENYRRWAAMISGLKSGR